MNINAILVLIFMSVDTAHLLCTMPSNRALYCAGSVLSAAIEQAIKSITRITLVNVEMACSAPLSLDGYPSLSRVVLPEKRFCKCFCGGPRKVRGQCGEFDRCPVTSESEHPPG
jgi:hypothetical protein